MRALRPGGELARRPLHFIWICDCSGSMSVEGKIQALNSAIRQALPPMRRVADENPNAQVLLRVLRFSHGAAWHVASATPLEDLKWPDLAADRLARSAGNADVVFMVDTSGSMSDEIEAVKGSCVTFADRIIEAGAGVRLGLIGFDIGGHRGAHATAYKVYSHSAYTIGIWKLSPPSSFRTNIQSLSVGLFGGMGCYLANPDTVDIFAHVVRTFEAHKQNPRVLVVISDEMGSTAGLSEIVAQLKRARITAYVLGLPGKEGAHESLATRTGGKFWDITKSKGTHDFGDLLQEVAQTIAKEVTQRLADGTTSGGADMGAALRAIAEELKMPPMTDRALPPVLVLVSDGQPTDDFEAGLRELQDQPWGRKAVRVAIAIGKDADLSVLEGLRVAA